MAFHEAAHFTAMYVEGFGAEWAEIHDRGYSWDGLTASIDTLSPEQPAKSIRNACIILAGPLAEEPVRRCRQRSDRQPF